MAIKEQDKVFYEELANGDKVINLPITRVNNVEGLGRSANTAYVVGDVVYVDNNKKVALKCTQAGTTSNSELNVSTASIGNVITDGTVVWQVCNRTSDVTSVNGKTGDVVVDLPVGHMYWNVEPNVPAGRLPALGATYNRALYADLWAWANSVGLVKTESEWQAIASANGGNCTYYSSGDGSTTFRVPKLPTTIASDVPSEVPVVGNGMTLGLTNGTDSGAFVSYADGYNLSYIDKSNLGRAVGKGSVSYTVPPQGYYGVVTDTTKSGIVAKTSATKITGQWLIVAFGVAHNIGEVDVANVMQAVEQVQTGLGKVDGIADYIVESYRNGTEWYEVYKSGKVRQGGYVAKASSAGFKTVTFLKPFADTNYSVHGGVCATGTGNASDRGTSILGEFSPSSATQMSVFAGTGNAKFWVAEGQGA